MRSCLWMDDLRSMRAGDPERVSDALLLRMNDHATNYLDRDSGPAGPRAGE